MLYNNLLYTLGRKKRDIKEYFITSIYLMKLLTYIQRWVHFNREYIIVENEHNSQLI